MAKVPGFGQGFNAAAFREAITNTMKMGLPEDETERATFKWKRTATFDVADPAGNPYRWDETPTKVTSHDDVQIPVAIEKNPGDAASQTPFASIESPRITVTVLDTYYTEIEGADTIEIDGTEYTINFVAPPVALFDVTVYTLYATADDEA